MPTTSSRRSDWQIGSIWRHSFVYLHVTFFFAAFHWENERNRTGMTFHGQATPCLHSARITPMTRHFFSSRVDDIVITILGFALSQCEKPWHFYSGQAFFPWTWIVIVFYVLRNRIAACKSCSVLRQLSMCRRRGRRSIDCWSDNHSVT